MRSRSTRTPRSSRAGSPPAQPHAQAGSGDTRGSSHRRALKLNGLSLTSGDGAAVSDEGSCVWMRRPVAFRPVRRA